MTHSPVLCYYTWRAITQLPLYRQINKIVHILIRMLERRQTKTSTLKNTSDKTIGSFTSADNSCALSMILYMCIFISFFCRNERNRWCSKTSALQCKLWDDMKISGERKLLVKIMNRGRVQRPVAAHLSSSVVCTEQSVFVGDKKVC